MLLLDLDGDTLDLSDYARTGVYVGNVDLGAPKVRDVVSDLVDRDGAGDETAYFGGRMISLSGTIVASPLAGTRQAILDRLRRFCHPGTRPTLTIALNDDVPRTIGLRPDKCAAPIERPGSCPFAVSWFAPDPRFYDAAGPQRLTIFPPVSPTAGRTYNLVFPRVYASAWGGSGMGWATVAGDAPTWPTLTIFGAATNPVITTDTGLVVAFNNLTLGTTDYATVDTATRAVWLNGDPTADRYATLDVTRTFWAPLLPGDQSVTFAATSFAAPAQLIVEWTNAYI